MTISEQTRAHLEASGTPNVANRLLRLGYRNVVLNGVSPDSPDQPKLIGEAYTLRFIPAREDIDSMKNYGLETNKHRRAIEECPADHVLVIDAFDCLEASAMGDMMARRLAHRGVSGVVTNGGFRDSSGIAETGIPAYHRGAAVPATPIKLHPVALNEPVGLRGVPVYPGDVIFGDEDGVVVIPAHEVDSVAEGAADDARYELFAAEKIREGATLFEVFPSTPESYREYQNAQTERES